MWKLGGVSDEVVWGCWWGVWGDELRRGENEAGRYPVEEGCEDECILVRRCWIVGEDAVVEVGGEKHEYPGADEM